MDALEDVLAPRAADRGRRGAAGVRIHHWRTAYSRPNRQIGPAEKATSMNSVLESALLMQCGNYQVTRFNTLRHGVLSRYTVLPWEDEAEYQTLLSALVAEHSPVGLTEEHLVEELAGIIWRKRRLRLAEAAIYRQRLCKDAASNFEPEQIAGAALLPMIGKHKVEADIPRALTATSEETVRDLRDVKRDEAMTRKALNILVAGAPDTYSRALAALREDTRRCR